MQTERADLVNLKDNKHIQQTWRVSVLLSREQSVFEANPLHPPFVVVLAQTAARSRLALQFPGVDKAVGTSGGNITRMQIHEYKCIPTL